MLFIMMITTAFNKLKNKYRICEYKEDVYVSR